VNRVVIGNSHPRVNAEPPGFRFEGFGAGGGDHRFLALASLDNRVNSERPFRKRCTGHWTSADSPEFVTLDLDGQCSFRIGRYGHAGKPEYRKTERP